MQDGRLAAKQIQTAQTVLRVTEDGQPGRTRRVWRRSVPSGQNAPDNILVDANPEGQGDLVRDPWTTPCGIPLFHVEDGGHNFLVGSFWARLLPDLGREQQAIFPRRQRSMEPQERRGFQDDRGTDQPARTHEEHTHAGDDATARRRLGARFRERLRISNWCLTSMDSATTARAPPGPASRATVTRRWRNRTARSRMSAAYQDREIQEMLMNFAIRQAQPLFPLAT